ncbi:MAG: hypothetical protein F6K42_12975 [Leptolyngbya sp. SIO1D8]|nr:hypothetical protein [Leptolyngbya sp. SIO1D8]
MQAFNRIPIEDRANAIQKFEEGVVAGTADPLIPFKQAARERARERFFGSSSAIITTGLVSGGALLVTATPMAAAVVATTIFLGGFRWASQRWQDDREALDYNEFGYLLSDTELEDLEELVELMPEPKEGHIQESLNAAKAMVLEELGEVEEKDPKALLEGEPAIDVESKEVESSQPDLIPYEQQPEYTETNPWESDSQGNVFLDLEQEIPEYDPQWEHDRMDECSKCGITFREYTKILEGIPLNMPTPSPEQVAGMLGRLPAAACTSGETHGETTLSGVSRNVSETVSRNVSETVSRNVSGDFSGIQPEIVSEVNPQIAEPTDETTLSAFPSIAETPISPLSAKDPEETEKILLIFAPYSLRIDNEDALEVVKDAIAAGFSETWIRKNLFEGVAPGGSDRYHRFKEIVDHCRKQLKNG